ncbi:MAG: flippase-like domain-containing protein [Thermoplasmatales archaeon]|nr:flippase-like domain-containing protein [Candidatus Thermoplasmatota archaeon]MCL6003393.1 flippase-like domain-containing protein [Candidatus Thermoplasmatota archaeon]MDA8056093.1 flippase-like domain-containing protein [Thermoplasmatales archaeon]
MNLRSGSKFLGIAVSAVTLLIFIFVYGPENLLRTFSTLPSDFYIFFLAALALHVVSFLFWGLRIKLLSRTNGYKISFFKSFIAVMTSLFAASITPGYVGGEPVRIKKLIDYGEPAGTATAIALGERGFDSIFFVGVFAFAILTGLETLSGDLRILAMIGTVLLVLFLSFLLVSMGASSLMNRLKSWIERVARRFDRKGKKYEESLPKVFEHIEIYASSTKKIFLHHPGALIIGVLVTSLLWISDFMVPTALLIGFGVMPNLLDIIFIQIILVLISLIPVTPGSAGIMEVLMIATFSVFLPHGGIVAFVIIWRFITFYFNLIVGSLSLHYLVTK